MECCTRAWSSRPWCSAHSPSVLSRLKSRPARLPVRSRTIRASRSLARPSRSISEARGTQNGAGRHQRDRRFRRPERDPRHLHRRGRRCPGSSSIVRPGVAVSGGDRISVGALTLSVGGTSETVTVKSEAPLIQSQSGERSFRVTTAEVENLPIGTGRNFATFTSLTPGVVGNDDAARRRRPEQHHDGRRVHDGHRQQRAVAADESRGDRRGEGPDGRLSGRVRPVERPADHRRHQERDRIGSAARSTTSCGTPTGTRTAG